MGQWGGASQQAFTQHVLDKKKDPHLCDRLGKLRENVIRNPFGSQMRNRQPLVNESDLLVFDFVITNNISGGTTTVANIKKAALLEVFFKAFKTVKY